MLLKYLIFSSLYFLLPFQTREASCDLIVVSVQVEDDVRGLGQGRAVVEVKGAKPPIKYFFSAANGDLINTDFLLNRVESLKKGKYTCLIRESGDCRKKIEFEIK